MSGTAVFACYNPSDDLLENCRRVLEQGLRAIVVDDGSPKDMSALYAQIRALGIELIELEQNSGIGFALNRGIERSFADGADFVITLDQDTVLCDGYVDCVVETLKHVSTGGPVLLATEEISGYRPQDLGERNGLRLSREPLQSGLVVTARAYEIVGLLDEQLFIDCVDTEYYLRARERGVETLVAPGTKTIHELGDEVERRAPRILSLTRKAYTLREHAPFRLYYIARNRAYVYARYGRRHPTWLKSSSYELFVTLFNEIVLPPDSTLRLFLVLRGFYGAARKEYGRIPAQVDARARKISR
ncbi:glycosyltransferase [Antrihabitans cavernicola]|uniref:glycosyltransferase n=1 Tax=Antrihabitans cavernicola TaxID=2495913 RepID=UPI001659D61D|nr:glycosyltransferase [Spelaeibacter cavernicola]